MRILLALAVLGVVACGGEGPTEPPPSDSLAGKWTASRVGDWQGVTLYITESSSQLRGTWTGHIGGGLRSGAILAGSRDGQRFTLTLDTGGMPCGYGTYVEAEKTGTTATGTAWMLSCGGGRNVASEVKMSK